MDHAPGGFEPADARSAGGLELGHLMVMCGHAVFAAVNEAAEQLCLPVQDVHALYVLQTHGPLPAGALAQLLHIKQPAVTALAARLEADGLITRQRDSQDKRRVWLHVNDTGARTAQRARELARPALTQLFAGLAPATAMAVAALLGDIVEPWLAARLPGHGARRW